MFHDKAKRTQQGNLLIQTPLTYEWGQQSWWHTKDRWHWFTHKDLASSAHCYWPGIILFYHHPTWKTSWASPHLSPNSAICIIQPLYCGYWGWVGRSFNAASTDYCCSQESKHQVPLILCKMCLLWWQWRWQRWWLRRRRCRQWWQMKWWHCPIKVMLWWADHWWSSGFTFKTTWAGFSNNVIIFTKT